MLGCTPRGHNTTERHTFKQGGHVNMHNHRYVHLSNPHAETIALAQSVECSQ